MEERIDQTTETVTRDQTPIGDRQTVQTTNRSASPDTVPGKALAARIVWLITGVILSLLALRFLLSLLGANRENGFADLIYSVTQPFAAPFFGLFNYTATYGKSRFEFETLVAIAVYALVGLLIAKVVTLSSRDQY